MKIDWVNVFYGGMGCVVIYAGAIVCVRLTKDTFSHSCDCDKNAKEYVRVTTVDYNNMNKRMKALEAYVKESQKTMLPGIRGMK